MGKRDYIFDGFISYRHADLDKFVAERLQKSLEGFKIPRRANEKAKTNGKDKIERIFRDKDELPIGSDLATPIIDALKESEFLLVICSPRTPESIWVQREIDTFISMHGRENVLAILIEGEPNESFPKTLLQIEKEVTLPDGSTTVEIIPIEPLAADVRGKNKSEVAKNIKRETMRLAAPMFHCGYDDLRQRNKERKARRIMAIFAALSAFFLIFGSYSTFQALKIKNQSDQIQEQSNKIIIEQFNTIGDKSLELSETGDRDAAIKKALEAFPDNKYTIIPATQNRTYPITARAQYALTEALQVYTVGSVMQPTRLFQHDASVEYVNISPSDKTIVTVDAASTLYIWEAYTGKLIKTIQLNLPAILGEENSECIFLKSDSEVVYPTDESIVCYDFKKDKVVWTVENVDTQVATCSKDDSIIAVSDYSKLTIIDVDNGKILYEVDGANPEDINSVFGRNLAISSDNKLIALRVTGGYQLGNEEETLELVDTTEEVVDNATEKAAEETAEEATESPSEIEKIIAININTGELVSEFTPNEKVVTDIRFLDNESIIVSDVTFAEDSSAIIGSEVSCYNTRIGETSWIYETEGEFVENIKQGYDVNNTICVQTQYDILTLSGIDGELKSKAEFGDDVIRYQVSDDGSICFALLSNGNIEYVQGSIDYYYTIYEGSTNNIKDGLYCGDYCIYAPINSSKLIFFEFSEGSKIRELFAENYPADMLDINTNCDRYVVKNISGNQINVYSAVSNTLLFSIAEDEDNLIYNLFYGGKNDEYIVVVTSKIANVYDSKTGKKVKEIAYTDDYLNNSNINKQDGLFYVYSDKGFDIFDLTTLEKVKRIDKHGEIEIGEERVSVAKDEFVIGNTASGCLEVYPLEKDYDANGPTLSIPIRAAYISRIFYSSDESKIFVVYKDKKTEVYDANDLKLQFTFEALSFSPTSAYKINDKEDYILAGSEDGYMCNKDNEYLAYFDGLKEYNQKENKVILTSFVSLYSIPVYTNSMLFDEAKEKISIENKKQ